MGREAGVLSGSEALTLMSLGRLGFVILTMLKAGLCHGL